MRENRVARCGLNGNREMREKHREWKEAENRRG